MLSRTQKRNHLTLPRRPCTQDQQRAHRVAASADGLGSSVAWRVECDWVCGGWEESCKGHLLWSIVRAELGRRLHTHYCLPARRASVTMGTARPKIRPFHQMGIQGLGEECQQTQVGGTKGFIWLGAIKELGQLLYSNTYHQFMNLNIICIWYANNMHMICMWYVYVCIWYIYVYDMYMYVYVYDMYMYI